MSLTRRAWSSSLGRAAIILALVFLAFAAAQIALPRIVASNLRERVARDGVVDSVAVSAFPAVKLLWGQADHVRIDMSSLHTSNRRAGELLAQATAAREIDVRVGTLIDGPVTLTNVTLRKRGDELTGEAALSPDALRRALPAGFSAQPVASGGGRLLLRAQASLFGFGLAADVLLGAQAGALVLEPVGIPLASGLRLTVFADPHVQVEAIGAQAQPGGGYLVTARGRVHS